MTPPPPAPRPPAPSFPGVPWKAPDCAMCPPGESACHAPKHPPLGTPGGSAPGPRSVGARAWGWGARSINFPGACAKARPASPRARRAPVPVPLGVPRVRVGVGGGLPPATPPPNRMHEIPFFTQSGGECHLPPTCTPVSLRPCLGLCVVPRPPPPFTPAWQGVGGAPAGPAPCTMPRRARLQTISWSFKYLKEDSSIKGKCSF